MVSAFIGKPYIERADGKAEMEDDDHKTIEHNPHETRPTNFIWWILWPLLALLWGHTLLTDPDIQWSNVLLALGTGIVLCGWAIEITGNKVPDSWRG
jgi:hypothetical protein